MLVPCLPLETEPVVLLRTEEVLPELLVLVTLPEETVETSSRCGRSLRAATLGDDAAVDGAVAGAGGAASGELRAHGRNVVGSGRIRGALAAR